MKVEAKTFDEFFGATGKYEDIARQLDKIITEQAPNLKRELFQGMSMTCIAYGIVPYTYASGRSGEWPLIAIAPQKNYSSLYVCATVDGEYYAEKYADTLGKVSCGRSCIRFKKAEDINTETVKVIVAEVARRHSVGETLFGI